MSIAPTTSIIPVGSVLFVSRLQARTVGNDVDIDLV
jgi:hypothetical protein